MIVQQLRRAQAKPRIIKINWQNDVKWLCTTSLIGLPNREPSWSGYGSTPASAYADWYRKNNGDKWTIG
jgi:hypothetical protein